MADAGHPEGSDLERLRRILAAILMVGMVGVAAELSLLGHTEEWRQWIPISLLGIGLAALLASTLRPTGASVRVFLVVMLHFVASGALGIFLHYRGNVEFELEMAPSSRGLDLVWEALTGATPALAPGTMTLLGLVGLAVGYKHPALGPRRAPRVEQGAES